jgi:hypothetical protein
MQSTVILGPAEWERFSSRTPVEHARAHSLYSCNLLPLAFKREIRGPFRGTSSGLFTVTSSFSSREEPPSSTSSQPWLLRIIETWDQAPSLAHLYPLLQISANNTTSQTGRRVLLSGDPNQYKSCVPPICATVRGPTRNLRN